MKYILSILTILLIPNFASAELNIQFWHSMSGGKAQLIDEMAKEFNELPQNKGKIKVQPQFVGTYEEGLNKTRTALLAKHAPHIAQITDIGTQVMIDTKGIEPLQNFVDKDPTFPIKEILPQFKRYYQVGGRLYSLPFATSNPILYYNADAFQKAGIKSAPKTFAELREVAKKLTNKADKFYGITWPLNSWLFEEFLAKQGQTLLNNDNGRKGRGTEANFTSPEAIAFVKLWADMVKDGSFTNVGRGWDPAEQNFVAGRSAMLISSSSDVYIFQKKAQFKLATAPLPANNANAKGGTIVGGNSLWILKGKPAEEQQAAYEFVKWMASKPMQKKWHINTGYFPIRNDLIADFQKEGFYKQFPIAWVIMQQLQASPDMPATAGALTGVFPELREQVESAVERVLNAGETPEVALKKAKEETEKALARYNKNRN